MSSVTLPVASRRSVWERLAVLVVALLATAAVSVVFGPGRAVADDNALILPGDLSRVTLGPNAVLRVDGRLRSFNNCTAPGIADFVYPASDIYVVAATSDPSDGAVLTDVTGNPATIVQGGTAFSDEIIAITAPGGTLAPGRYSVVYDTCQDGRFQVGTDQIFHDVIEVVFPSDIPDAAPWIAELKQNAHTAWGDWKTIGKLFDTLLNVDKAAGCLHATVSDCVGVLAIWVESPTIQAWLSGVETIVGENAARCAGAHEISACFGVLYKFWSPDTAPIRTFVTSGTKNLIANQAKAHFGVYADPPRGDFATPTSAAFGGDVAYPVPVLNGDGVTFDSMSWFASALEREVLLRQALLAALERYQGAQAAGDPVAARAQARTAAGLAAVLADAQGATLDGIEAMMEAVDVDVADVDEILLRNFQRLGDITGKGFRPEQDRALRNAGLAGSARIELLARLVTTMRLDTVRPADDLRTAIDRLAAGAAASRDTMNAVALDLGALAESITGLESDDVPTITVGAHRNATIGVALPLTAVASAATTVAWDLDADGDFDDATGASIVATFASAGHRVVAAKATNAAGVAVVAHALIDVDNDTSAPTIAAAVPDPSLLVAGVVGVPSTFAVTVADADDDQADMRFQWFLDGVAIPGATAASVAITAGVADRGAHTVNVVVRDTQPGNTAQAVWRWMVSDVDADGDGWSANEFADCDDANPNVNPGRLEELFNGVDDDCDPATPDRPLELAVGQLWGWGNLDGSNGTGSGVGSSTPRYQGVDNVAQAVAAWIAGALLDDQGRVWAWGSGSMAGDGNPAPHVVTTPQPVVPPGWGGEPGQQLGDVVRLTSSMNWFGALTSDGRVLTWGHRVNGALGQNNPIQAEYPVPGYVVDATGAPITGVTAIEGAYGAGYAILTDGTAMLWGQGMCSPGNSSYYHHAIRVPEIDRPGTTIVQIEGGPQQVLVRYADGTVGRCSGAFNPIEYFDVGAFGGARVVDIAPAAASAGSYALTADGSVWVTGKPTDMTVIPLQTEEPVTPTQWTRVVLPPGAPVVAFDGADSPAAMFVVRADGTALSWGDTLRDNDGQGSDGVRAPNSVAVTPGALAIPGQVRDISGGGYNTSAVVGRDGGDVWTWGAPGTALGRSGGALPAPVPGVTNVVEVVSNTALTYALTSRGDVIGWGSQPNRAFSGNGPAPVFAPGAASGRLRGVTDLVGGASSMAALLANGRVVTWGTAGATGALGAGSDLAVRNYPDHVVTSGASPLEGVVRLFGGNDGGVAVRGDGSVWQWGARHCADGPVATSRSNVALPAVGWPADIAQYSGAEGGSEQALVRRADGTVMSCGEVAGDFALAPVAAITADDPAIDVAATSNHMWIVTANGELWAWITADAAATTALGIEPATWERVALPVGARPVDVEADRASVHVRLGDGSVITFGDNASGKLGRGGDAWKLLPAQIGGHVLDTSSKTANAAAVVLPDSLVARTGWVPPQSDIEVSAVGASGPEGGVASVAINLASAADTELNVEWMFGEITGATTIPAGTTTVPIELQLPAPDGVWGVDRRESLVLTGVTAGAILADEVAEVMINDVDPPPTISLSPVEFGEGDGALTGHRVAVELSGPAGIDVPIRVVGVDGSAVAGVDYRPLDVEVVLAAGATRTEVPFIVVGNRLPQADRTLTVTATSRLLAASIVDAVIVDDDPVALVATGDRVMAGDTATVTLTVPGLPTGERVTVQWSTVDGDAVAPGDYEAGSGTVTIVGNASSIGSATIEVRTIAPPPDGAQPLEVLVRRNLSLALAATGERLVLGPDRVAVGIDRLDDGTPPTTTVPPTTVAPTTVAPTTVPPTTVPPGPAVVTIPTDPPAVAPATTVPMPWGVLPETGGGGSHLAAYATMLIAAGAVMLIVRRRTRPTRCR